MKKLSLCILLVFPALDARADIPPPKGYVEQCVVKKVQKKGEFCTACSADRGDREICKRTFSQDNLLWELRCRTRSASTWKEIWCTPWVQQDPPNIPDPEPKKSP